MGAWQHLRGSNMRYLGKAHGRRSVSAGNGRQGLGAAANGRGALARMGKERRRAQTPPRRLIRAAVLGHIASLLHRESVSTEDPAAPVPLAWSAAVCLWLATRRRGHGQLIRASSSCRARHWPGALDGLVPQRVVR